MDFKQVQRTFAGHIRDPQSVPRLSDVEDRRMAIYRDLFFNNVESFLANSYPVIRKLLGKQQWHTLIRDFLIQHRARTPLFSELPRELLQYLEQHAEEDPQRPFLLELAHYEWVELALSIAVEEPPLGTNSGKELLESPLRKSPVAWVLSYNYPVHQIKENFQPHAPLENPVHLVVYRDPEDQVKFLQLNAVSARLLQLVDQSVATGRAHLTQVAEEMGVDVDQKFLAQGSELLIQLNQRSVIFVEKLN